MSVRESLHISPVFPPSPKCVESLISKLPFDSQALIPVILIGMFLRILDQVENPVSNFIKNILYIKKISKILEFLTLAGEVTN